MDAHDAVVLVDVIAPVGAAAGSLLAAYLLHRSLRLAKAKQSADFVLHFNERHERLGDKVNTGFQPMKVERLYWELQEDQVRAYCSGDVLPQPVLHWLEEREKNWQTNSYILGEGYRDSWRRARSERPPSVFRTAIDRAHQEGGKAAFEWLKRKSGC